MVQVVGREEGAFGQEVEFGPGQAQGAGEAQLFLDLAHRGQQVFFVAAVELGDDVGIRIAMEHRLLHVQLAGHRCRAGCGGWEAYQAPVMSAARATHSGCICDGWAPVSGGQWKMEGMSGIQQALNVGQGLGQLGAGLDHPGAGLVDCLGGDAAAGVEVDDDRKPARRSCSTLVLTQ